MGECGYSVWYMVCSGKKHSSSSSLSLSCRGTRMPAVCRRAPAVSPPALRASPLLRLLHRQCPAVRSMVPLPAATPDLDRNPSAAFPCRSRGGSRTFPPIPRPAHLHPSIRLPCSTAIRAVGAASRPNQCAPSVVTPPELVPRLPAPLPGHCRLVLAPASLACPTRHPLRPPRHYRNGRIWGCGAASYQRVSGPGRRPVVPCPPRNLTRRRTCPPPLRCTRTFLDYQPSSCRNPRRRPVSSHHLSPLVAIAPAVPPVFAPLHLSILPALCRSITSQVLTAAPTQRPALLPRRSRKLPALPVSLPIAVRLCNSDSAAYHAQRDYYSAYPPPQMRTLDLALGSPQPSPPRIVTQVQPHRRRTPQDQGRGVLV